MTTPNKILANGNVIYKEAVPAAAFNPGHLVQYDTAGKFKKHATDGGAGLKMVAIENDLEGEGVSDAYGTSDRARAVVLAPGSEVHMKIKNGENIAKSDLLCSAGDGTLREVVTDSSGTIAEDVPLFTAMEACDMSGSSGEDPDGWCRVMAL
jgi:hypothetical protein